jgi:hypothetical protein
MIYSKAQIELLSEALRGDNAALKMLSGNANELVALESALRGDTKSMEWLLKNYKDLALFVEAVDGNRSAMKILFTKKYLAFAAVANLLNEDIDAAGWLMKHKMGYYVKLAESIKYAQEKRSGSDMAVFFKPFG